ncbi:integrase [Methylohalomonas lacus]|uniref:Integrase n=1 Tax=Methylohalomonas lacus TaxID=398773 RepID=A0AAE3HKF3_9GAMM|nr:site-specific integrase [Methylohalomonas lacus]MCS3902083.1 integrase [Methylohalomonas lacus]
MGKLSDTRLRAIVKAGKPVAGVADGDGLTFTLSAKGTASWVLRYRFGGRQKEMTLGRYPDMTLKMAREEASKARVRIAAGTDVGKEKQIQKASHRTAGTVKDLCDEFMRRVVEKERKRPEYARRMLKKDVIPTLGKYSAREVTDRQIINLLDRIVDRGSPTQANHALRLLKQLFRYGVSRRYLDKNPCAEITAAAAGGKEKARTRALSKDELGKFLKALNETDIHAADRLALKIILATCVRVGEMVKAEWSDIDLENGVWHIPAEHTKTGEAIDIPLVPKVIEWFEALKPYAGESLYVLPARRRRNKTHLKEQTLRATLRKADGALPYFTIHDLRRTARTHLAALGISRDVAERCLNHKIEGLDRVYNQHDYFDERRQALELYTSLLQALESGQAFNVVSLAQGQSASA